MISAETLDKAAEHCAKDDCTGCPFEESDSICEHFNPKYFIILRDYYVTKLKELERKAEIADAVEAVLKLKNTEIIGTGTDIRTIGQLLFWYERDRMEKIK